MKSRALILSISILIINIVIIAKNGIINNKAQNKQIYIKAGSYFIGSNKESDNKPLREMYFNAFYMDIHPVSNGQYIDFLKKSNYKPEGGFSIKKAEKAINLPATELIYKDAVAYAKFFKKRLPTEWEWEIVARTLSKNPNYDVASLSKKNRGHFYQNKIHSKLPVMSYSANKLGLYGMAGNIYEWTTSLYEKKYLYGKHIKKNKVMVLRGGAWTNNSSDIRPTTRTPFPANKHLNWIGFRCVSD